MLQNSEISSFLEYMQKNKNASINTLDAYKRTLLQAMPLVEEETQENVRRFDVTPFRLKIASLARKSIAQKISALRSFFDYLTLIGHTVKVVGDEQIKVKSTLPKPVNNDTITQALSNADIELRVLMLLMYGAGLRFFEATNLKISDISCEWIRVKGKGGKIRDLPLLNTIKVAIDEYLAVKSPKIYLFEEENVQLSASVLRYRLMKSLKQNQIHFTPHQLRHSFATMLINDGARINDVSEALGHSQLSTTKIYTQLAASSKLRDYAKAHPLWKE